MTIGAVTRPHWIADPWGPAFVQTPPAAVTNLRVTDDHYYTKHATLEWNWIERGETIRVYRNNTLLATLEAGSTKYVDTNLVLDTTYNYRVEASNSAGTSAATLSHLFTTRIPSVGWNTAYQVVPAVTSHQVNMPPVSEYRPYDIIFVAVERSGTAFGTSPNAGWSQWGGVAHVSGTVEFWYYRVQPASPGSLDPAPVSFPLNGASSELAVWVAVVHDVDVYTNQFLFKEPYINYAAISVQGPAAGSTYPSAPTFPYSGSGLLMAGMGGITSATVTNFNLTEVDVHENTVKTPQASGRTFLTMNWVPMTSTNAFAQFRKTYSHAGNYGQQTIWFPEAAVAKISTGPSIGLVTSTAATNANLTFGTNTPATGDHALGFIVLNSGTGAVNATISAGHGFAAPVKHADTTNTHPSVRVVVFSSYGTNATNTGGLTMNVTYPSGTTALVGTVLIKGLPQSETAVSGQVAGNTRLTVPVPSRSFLMGFLASSGLVLSTAGKSITNSEGLTKSDADYYEMGTGSAARVRESNTTAPNLGVIWNFGEAHRAGDAVWDVTLPAGYNVTPLKLLVALPIPNGRFGNSTSSAVAAPVVTQFAAFGIPL